MGKPAARISDMHTCPMVTPGLPPIPHVGGPITGPGCPTVLIGGMPAAVMGDMCVCVGPPDTIILGSTGVMIGGKPAARMGDQCAHGGSIVVGCPTVLIGEVSGAAPATIAAMPLSGLISVMQKTQQPTSQIIAQVIALTNAAQIGVPFCEKCEEQRLLSK
ncbi:MAG: PAAR domain-containing protein [Ferruginibacter sp.]